MSSALLDNFLFGLTIAQDQWSWTIGQGLSPVRVSSAVLTSKPDGKALLT